MFGFGFWEVVVLGGLALLIFGPDQLPKAIKQVGGVVRQLRRMADSTKRDLQQELGPEFRDFDVADLNPRRFVRKHLWEQPEEAWRAQSARNGGARSTSERLGGRRPPFDNEAT
ncbi:sec-independent translocase [Lipingzhangella sp. LS1_29]|uniref:Sec-independent translocase n=1 Tax=Lipingzhangella rawalii TaxID=2055835 RepID=A0ABU2H672_9ACTN|nr:sec-independent translocase [Lipingzhangella rawalii]MDS1270360.1 sec-independent translocase [Lipingzhangella rawalii]